MWPLQTPRAGRLTTVYKLVRASLVGAIAQAAAARRATVTGSSSGQDWLQAAISLERAPVRCRSASVACRSASWAERTAVIAVMTAMTARALR
ncbi:hypothetical protein GCM10023334_037780 [Nonomuraea thailandensis]